MMIDFKEIPQANTGVGDQDHFELFAEEFLRLYGYEIIVSPSRGADGGKDGVVQETKVDENNNEVKIRYLLSCKHFAHSKGQRAVAKNDELDIKDRLFEHNCQGFLGFYSTVLTTTFDNHLNKIKKCGINVTIFKKSDIEAYLTSNVKMDELFKRYFPKSYQKWIPIATNFLPIKLFEFLLEKDSLLKFKLEIFLIIFGNKLENLLLEVRRCDDFSSFIKKFPFKVEKTDIVSLIELIVQNRSYGDLTFKQLSGILEHELPKSFNHNKYDHSQLLVVTYDKNVRPKIVLYDNLLVINYLEEENLISLFSELKYWLR